MKFSKSPLVYIILRLKRMKQGLSYHDMLAISAASRHNMCPRSMSPISATYHPHIATHTVLFFEINHCRTLTNKLNGTIFSSLNWCTGKIVKLEPFLDHRRSRLKGTSLGRENKKRGEEGRTARGWRRGRWEDEVGWF